MKGTPSTFYKKLDQKYASATFASQSSTRWNKWKAHLQWVRNLERRIWFTAGAAARGHLTLGASGDALHADSEKAKDWESTPGRRR